MSEPTLPSMPFGTGSLLLVEVRTLRNLLLAGCAAICVVAGMELAHGQMAPLDRWAYPLMLLLYGLGALLLHRWPSQVNRVRLGTVLSFNGYLVLSLHSMLFGGPQVTDMYQLVSLLCWIPLGYGSAFVFLSHRTAMLVSGLIYLSSFGPALWLLWRGPPAHWAPSLAPILANVAVAQLVYVVLLQAISRLRRDYRHARERMLLMHEVARTDVLTGTANRRATTEQLAAGLALLRRGLQPLSVILLDVDHFKRVNDLHGHAAGDAVLVDLARLLARELRGSDHLGRWGGEEFIVLAAATGQTAATELAERMRLAVATHRFAHGEPVTISLGVAAGQAGDSPEQLVGRADRALYEAKHGGRNQTRGSALRAA